MVTQFRCPGIGEHTEYACRDILDMEGSRVNEYLVEGVLEIG